MQRATDPRLLRDSPQPAESNLRPRGHLSNTVTTRPLCQSRLEKLLFNQEIAFYCGTELAKAGNWPEYRFYHAMLRTAQYCYGKVDRPSVRDVEVSDHIGWKSSKITSRSFSWGCSLLANPTSRIYFTHIQWQVVAEWLEIEQWSQWEAYSKPTSFFPVVRSMTPYDLLFPQNWCPKCISRYLLII